MPEIKNNFTGGKMNKDLDERIIPNGEYKHAMNIQVSTSEGSDVGTIQNVLGNSQISDSVTAAVLNYLINPTCVASISDEKNDTLYWFLSGDNRNYILRYKETSGSEVVFADVNNDTLGFQSNNIITGINIIDDLLLWTDNVGEPKKINIPNCVAGTNQSANIHTKIVNPNLGYSLTSAPNYDVKEEHITVIKKSPTTALEIEYLTGRDPQLMYSGVMHITQDPGYSQNTSSFTGDFENLYDFSSIEIGESFQCLIDSDIDGNNDFTLQWNIGDKVVIKEFFKDGSPPNIPITDYRIRGVITEWIDTYSNNPCDDRFHRPGQAYDANPNNYNPPLFTQSGKDCNRFFEDSTTPGYNPSSIFPGDLPGTAKVQIMVTAIEGFPPSVIDGYDKNYAIDLYDETEKLFEFRFPRFSYRYRYTDGEYSCFAPWSEVAFMPGSFDHHPKKGYNLGMTNRLISLNVRNFRDQFYTPKDIEAIDILYKEDGSANVYTVETIKPKDDLITGQPSNWWSQNKYHITSETIHAVLPSNQILRPWDNVPRRALGQEVTGNRVVYGNYVQNYNLDVYGSDKNYYPDFKHSINSVGATPSNAQRSIKSLREYQLGVTFIDEYGRETPVITSPSGTFKLDKSHSNTHNRITVGFNGTGYPVNMKSFKFYIKETSGEYYNMAMDRFYDAEDGNAWLAFPSSDRNKVDIDTFLILKKGQDSDDPVLEPARFKILAIEDSAPDYVRTSRILIEDKTHSLTESVLTNLFGNSMTNVPSVGADYFQVNYEPFFLSSGGALHEIREDLYVEFSTTNEEEVSDRYRISEISCSYKEGLNNISDSKYNIKLEKPFGGDINFISDDPTGLNSTKIKDSAQIRFYKYKIENKPQFDGRFFVKILNDDVFRKYIKPSFRETDDYKVVASIKTNYLKDSFHDSNVNPLIDQFEMPAHDISLGLMFSPGNWSTDPTYNPYAPSKHHFQAYFQDFHFADDGGAGNSWPPIDTNYIGVISSWEHYGWTMYWPSGHPENSFDDKMFSPIMPKKNWFVDNGAYHAYSLNDNLDLKWDINGNLGYIGLKEPFGNGNYGFKGECKGLGEGIINLPNEDRWTIDLGFGGVWSHDWEWNGGSYDIINNFFTVGRSGGNPKHEAEQDFVEKLVPGTKFRWREDPHRQIYTIQSGVQEKRRVRYWSYSGNQSPDGGGNTWFGSGWYSPAPGSPQDIREDKNRDAGDHLNLSFTNPANFTKNWIISAKPQLIWDPTETGIISNGHEIRIDEANISITVATPFDPNNVYVTVDHIHGECQTVGGTWRISPGMMITHYNDDGTAWPNSGASCGFSGGGPVIKEIEYVEASNNYKLFLAGYKSPLSATDVTMSPSIVTSQYITVKQVGMNTVSQTFIENYHNQINKGGEIHVKDVGYTLELIEPVEPVEVVPDDPAVFETEPKETTDLNIYYEASGALPLQISNVNEGSRVFRENARIILIDSSWNIVMEHIVPNQLQWNNNAAPPCLSVKSSGNLSSVLAGTTFTAPLQCTIINRGGITLDGYGGFVFTCEVFEDITDVTRFNVKGLLYSSDFQLTWHNCYSFGNGVESNRIRDNFNLPFILNGVKVSTTLAEQYKEEHRKYGLIYSGIYNSISGVNNLNQFIQAEKITKDINPIYGSIQKLHSRDTDLITLCEDKILKILANKDAVYNADGNAQLTATQNVLGQTIPFNGEYGISTNPESFASEAYRSYFTDKVRGSVMRLSMDGLTPISNHGMKDWFKDNLKLGDKLIGSYDDKKDEYNLTIK